MELSPCQIITEQVLSLVSRPSKCEEYVVIYPVYGVLNYYFLIAPTRDLGGPAHHILVVRMLLETPASATFIGYYSCFVSFLISCPVQQTTSGIGHHVKMPLFSINSVFCTIIICRFLFQSFNGKCTSYVLSFRIWMFFYLVTTGWIF